MENKTTLRKKFLDLRMHLSDESREKKSQKIMENIETILSEKTYSKVFLFSSFKGEPDLLTRLPGGPYMYGLPVVGASTSEMNFHRYESGENLIRGAFGILRPSSNQILKPDSQTLILTPALAATKQGFRLGYGRGYYDRYLAKHPAATSAIVVFQECLTSEFLPEAHDIAASIVITDAGIFKI